MAKIQVVSDLHFEFIRTREGMDRIFSPDDVDADILVMAGDLCNSPESISNFIGCASRIIVVLGNHEYYGHGLNRLEHWRAWANETNGSVMVMDNEVVEFPEYDLRIIGSTLWASLAEGTHAAACKQMIADFSTIRGMTVDVYLNLHQKARDYITHALATPYEGKTVVVTHNAPSWKSQHPKFAGSMVGGLFCSNLEDLMEKYEPEFWIHGHTHDPWDYTVFKTRVICNPSGYMGEKKTLLNKNLIIEI